MAGSGSRRTDGSVASRDASGAPTDIRRLAEALDDGDGDRGDVAAPAVHMPRSNGHSGVPGGLTPAPPVQMASRCKACGAALSVRDVKRGGTCADCDDTMDEQRPGGGLPVEPPTPDNESGRPGGGLTAPRTARKAAERALCGGKGGKPGPCPGDHPSAKPPERNDRVQAVHVTGDKGAEAVRIVDQAGAQHTFQKEAKAGGGWNWRHQASGKVADSRMTNSLDRHAYVRTNWKATQ